MIVKWFPKETLSPSRKLLVLVPMDLPLTEVPENEFKSRIWYVPTWSCIIAQWIRLTSVWNLGVLKSPCLPIVVVDLSISKLCQSLYCYPFFTVTKPVMSIRTFSDLGTVYYTDSSCQTTTEILIHDNYQLAKWLWLARPESNGFGYSIPSRQ